VVLTRPRKNTLLEDPTTRPVPALLKAEPADTSVLPAAAAARLAVDLKRFLSGANLAQ
jgi:hypothetical protein